MTRLVLFDLDNTLIDRAAAFRAWAETFAGPEHVAWLEEEDGDGLVPRAAFFERVRRRAVAAREDRARRARRAGRRLGDLRARRRAQAGAADLDVAGARACGLRSVWIDRGRRWPPELPRPDHVAGSVAEAAAVVLADANSSGAPAAQP